MHVTTVFLLLMLLRVEGTEQQPDERLLWTMSDVRALQELQKYAFDDILMDNETNSTIFDLNCTETRCPFELRGDGICQARCNTFICDFDLGDCDDLGVNEEQEDSTNVFIQSSFAVISFFSAFCLMYFLCRWNCLLHSDFLGMTPWDYVLVKLGRKTKAEVTGSSEQDDTDVDGDEEVRVASPVTLAVEFNQDEAQAGSEQPIDQIEGETAIHGESPALLLPVANRASISSGALPTADEYDI